MKSSTESSVTSNQSDDVKTVISNTMVSSTDDIDLDDELIVIETEENSSVPEVKLQSGGHTTIMTGTNCDIKNEKHVNIILKAVIYVIDAQCTCDLYVLYILHKKRCNLIYVLNVLLFTVLFFLWN